jgi:GPI-anchor transamidase subunit GAA1
MCNAISTDATEEAIVVVLPSLEMSGKSKLYKALFQSIANLADPIASPWLAKTVYFVTPLSPRNESLDQTVDLFLNAYLGERKPEFRIDNKNYTAVPPLPPRFSTAILRNLIVLDVHDNSTSRVGNSNNNNKANQLSGKTHLAILPQGRKGVLPNGDLVFVIGKLLERASFFNARLYQNSESTFLTHSYTQQSLQASSAIQQMLQHDMVQNVLLSHTQNPKMTEHKLQSYANDLINMLLFVRTMAFGPTPPHAAALDRGIDSLTLQVDFEGLFQRDPSEELMQYVLFMVRSLGNLHERLHHSVTLYWLPTPKTFVSHMEYFLPNVLLLLPLAIRAFGLLLPALLDQEKKSTTSSQKTRVRLIQFGLCVLAAYILVPIAFANTALSYIPSLLVTPLVAFPDYSSWIR